MKTFYNCLKSSKRKEIVWQTWEVWFVIKWSEIIRTCHIEIPRKSSVENVSKGLDKVSIVLECQRTKMVKNIENLLGLVGYYKKLLRCFLIKFYP